MIACRKGAYLRGYMYDFIELFAPHLSRDKVGQAVELSKRSEVETLFAGMELPLR